MDPRYKYEIADHFESEIDKFIKGERISDVYMVEQADLDDYGFPEGWSIEVARIGSKGCLYIQIKHPNGMVNYTRNYYGLGALCYAKQNNQEFVICSTDYQCITVINVTTGVRHTYADIEAVEDGFGFCPVEARWDDDNNRLFIVGCIWAFPFEQMVCELPDLNHPEEGLSNAKYYDEDSNSEGEDE